MKKYAKLVLASVFFFSLSVMAQEQAPPQGRNGGPNEMRQGQGQGQRQQQTPQMRVDNMAKDITLTDVEKAKILVVFQKNDSIFTKFRTEVSRESPDFREKFKTLREAQDKDLEAVIGTEKFQAWQRIRAERRPPMNNARPANNNQ